MRVSLTVKQIAVVVSYYISSQFGISIYDQALINRGLPWLPDVRPTYPTSPLTTSFIVFL